MFESAKGMRERIRDFRLTEPWAQVGEQLLVIVCCGVFGGDGE